jgi:hypothetical protein
MVTTHGEPPRGVVFLVTGVLTPLSGTESGCWRALQIAAMMAACLRSPLA